MPSRSRCAVAVGEPLTTGHHEAQKRYGTGALATDMSAGNGHPPNENDARRPAPTRIKRAAAATLSRRAADEHDVVEPGAVLRVVHQQ
jgi:hypothetical protein